jgi:hypothetical protein
MNQWFLDLQKTKHSLEIDRNEKRKERKTNVRIGIGMSQDRQPGENVMIGL